MQKRYQVFVSSTYEDLKEERSKVITALLDLGHIPCGMEYFPAADEDAWNCIARLIPQCDYYVVLVAGRYGSIAPGETKSYTHKEYELAVASQVPVLGLLHERPEDLAKRLCESDPKIQRKLDVFRSLVKRRLCRFWTTPDQIPGELLGSLTHQINRIPRTGWVRADSIASDDAKNEIIQLHRELDKRDVHIQKLKKQAAENEDGLASGLDELRIRGVIDVTVSVELNENQDEISNSMVRCFEVITTWDLLLMFLGKKNETRWGSETFHDWIRTDVSEQIKKSKDGDKYEHSSKYDILFDATELEKIPNQLCALGLIVQRKITAWHRDEEWELTPKGILQARKLRALRKGELYPGEREWCAIKISGEVREQQKIVDKWLL